MADFLTDAAARHQHFLERFKTGQANKFEKFLRLADRRVRELLNDAGSIDNRRQLNQLQKQIRDTLNGTYTEWGDDLTADMVELMADEAQFEASTIEKFLDTSLKVPDIETLRSSAINRPFQGKTLRTLMRDFSADESDRIAGVIRQGFHDGRSVSDIARDIRGTKALQFKDGTLRQTDIAARRIARTATQHFASVARHEVYRENDDIISAYEWVSVLDSRTSSTCMTLDGQVFDIDRGPLPPAHPNCRSTTLPILDDETDPIKRDETYKRRVEGQETYGEWLAKQPKGFIEEALGKSKAALFRAGGLPVEKFTDRKNAPLTLEQLRRLNPKAWEKAGLDDR